MKQIKSLLLLRIRQGYRYLSEIGFGIILVAIFVLTGIIFNVLETSLNTSPVWAILLSFIALISVEIKRKDTFFLKSIFDSKSELTWYKFIENVMIVFPILIFQSIFLNWEIILCIILVCLTSAILPFHLLKSHSAERKRNVSFIPLTLFEIKFYCEKNFWQLIFIWLLMVLGSLHMSLWIMAVAILCVVPLDVYTPIESREMVNYKPLFVFKKITLAVKFFLAFVAFPTILTLIFTQLNILVLVYGIFALIMSVILSVTKKYSDYYGVNEFVPSSTSTMILIFLMLAPGGILITLTASIYNYFKAEKHMKNNYALL